MVSQAGSDVPGQAVLRGSGVAAPPLRELLPVGVIGNRLHSRPGLHSDGVLLLHKTECGAKPGPSGLSAGKVLPHLSHWLGHMKNILGAKPSAQVYIQDLTQHSGSPHLTDLNNDTQKSQVGATQKSKTGNLGNLEIPGAPGFSAFGGHPNT